MNVKLKPVPLQMKKFPENSSLNSFCAIVLQCTTIVRPTITFNDSSNFLLLLLVTVPKLAFTHLFLTRSVTVGKIGNDVLGGKGEERSSEF